MFTITYSCSVPLRTSVTVVKTWKLSLKHKNISIEITDRELWSINTDTLRLLILSGISPRKAWYYNNSVNYLLSVQYTDNAFMIITLRTAPPARRRIGLPSNLFMHNQVAIMIWLCKYWRVDVLLMAAARFVYAIQNVCSVSEQE